MKNIFWLEKEGEVFLQIFLRSPNLQGFRLSVFFFFFSFLHYFNSMQFMTLLYKNGCFFTLSDQFFVFFVNFNFFLMSVVNW